jgi:hypothetical protein
MESLAWEKFLIGTPGAGNNKYEVLSMSSLYFGPNPFFYVKSTDLFTN